MDITILIILLAVGTIIGIFGVITRIASLMLVTGFAYIVLGTVVSGLGIELTSGKIINTITTTINNTSTLSTNETIIKATTNNLTTNALGLFLLAIGLIIIYFFAFKSDEI